MTRIIKNTMERMAKAIVIHTYNDQAEALITESIALFEVVYARHHHPSILKHMTVIAAKHPKGFESDSNANVNLSGRRLCVGTRLIAQHWAASTEARLVLRDFNSYPGFAVVEGDDLFDRITAFANAEKELTAEVKRAYKEALGSLSQFSTVKSLRTKWPEVISVVEDLLPEENGLLPVVEVKRLNERFRLPAVAQ